MNGRVKAFSEAKGYGLITSEAGEDIFAHFSAIQGKRVRTLSEGELVEFERIDARHGPQAINIRSLVTFTQSAALRRGGGLLHVFDGEEKRLRVFLCHALCDKPSVRDLYQRLQHPSLDVWLDEEKLLPGQEWEREIDCAIRLTDVVLVCLSQAAVSKAGFIQKEIRLALDIADRQPEGVMFLIPVKLHECEVPERLWRWHWVNLDEKRGLERLMLALCARAETLRIRWQ